MFGDKKLKIENQNLKEENRLLILEKEYLEKK
jgi:hypothetical protein